MPDQSFTPRYYEIETALRARIARLQINDPLPSDAELCEEFGVSRMTARNAMQRLVQEGLVRREQGRGTFVAHLPVDRQLLHLRSFSSEMRQRGRVPTSELLHADIRAASPEESDALRLADGADIVSVTRLRLADNQPMAIEQAVLPGRLRQVLSVDLNTASLHDSITQLGSVAATGRGTVTAELASGDDAAHLYVARGSPLLVERRLIFDGSGAPIEFTQSRYVPDRYVLNVDFTIGATAPTVVPRSRPVGTRRHRASETPPVPLA